MICIGVDAHKSFSTLYALDDQSDEGLLALDKVPTEPAAFAAALGADFTEAVAVLEASTISCFVAEMLRPLVAEVIIADPKVMRQSVPHSRAKTDRHDARELARQLSRGLISPVFQHRPDNLARRALTRTTRSVTSSGTRLRNQLRSLLRLWGVECRWRDLCGEGALEFIAQVRLPEPAQTALRETYQLLQDTERARSALKKGVHAQSREHTPAQLLCTLPGIGPELALRIVAELGDIERFPRPQSFVNYCGLAPSVSQSGQRRQTGKLVKGNGHLKTAFCQAANSIGQQPRGTTPLHQYYRRALGRLGRNKANLTTARELARLVWHMLRTNEPYRNAS